MTGDPATFTYDRPISAKVGCSVCGRRGYAGGTWREVCQRGHEPCPDCERPLAVRLDGSPRIHTRCPTPTTQCAAPGNDQGAMIAGETSAGPVIGATDPAAPSDMTGGAR